MILRTDSATACNLTSDGHRVYLEAVETAFGSEVDYAMLVKMYDNDSGEKEKRYSPAECIGCRSTVISGNPEPPPHQH